MSKPINEAFNLKHVDGFDFDPSKAIKEKIIKETTTELEFLDQFRPAYSILSGSTKMARETVFERLGKKAKKVLKKVGEKVGETVGEVRVEIQKILGIVSICIKSGFYGHSSYHTITLLFNE